MYLINSLLHMDHFRHISSFLYFDYAIFDFRQKSSDQALPKLTSPNKQHYLQNQNLLTLLNRFFSKKRSSDLYRKADEKNQTIVNQADD